MSYKKKKFHGASGEAVVVEVAIRTRLRAGKLNFKVSRCKVAFVKFKLENDANETY